MKDFLAETPLLNYNSPEIQQLIKNKGWRELNQKDCILAIYNFVRDEILFGYNISDNIKATEVLEDGYGQCNTKGSLFMALLRAVGIPCRVHGFYVDKKVQKGAITGFYYQQSPKEILHSWVELLYNDEWLELEGFILDMSYLLKLKGKFNDCNGSFCGYGVATNDFRNPSIEWSEGNTYIQKDSIIKDLGIFNSPDELFAKNRQKLGRFKEFMFKHIVRHSMNKNIGKIRN